MSIAAAHASAFYREIAITSVIWAIKDDGGYPAPLNADGKRSMPFWSSELRAVKVISEVAAYKNFEVVAIDWVIFCERWVPGLIRDGLLVGVNWSGKIASGYDIDPMELLQNVVFNASKNIIDE